jgi:alanyl aminopeptidase
MLKGALASLALVLGCHAEPPAAAPPPPAPEQPRPVDPAGRLSDDVQPAAYSLNLSIAPERSGFSGRVQIEVQLGRSLDSIHLHARGLQLDRVSVTPAGSARPLVASPRQLSESGLTALDLPESIGPGAARIDIEYTASFNAQLRSLYKIEAGGAPYAFTQFEAIYARQAFPCFDEPRFKTPFDITLRVPSSLTGISNTRVDREVALDEGMKELVFTRTEKLPTYLIAFAVGPFDVVDAAAIAPSDSRQHPLPLRGVAARGRGPELAFALQETPRLVESLERYFGVAYPYDKLDLIAVPDFASGAMENAGAITFRDTLLLLSYKAPEGQRRASVSVNAHELAHQWFGNLVTMPWWDDIWLNEGFATWLAGRVVGDVHPEYDPEHTRVAGLERAFDMDAKESSRQVRQPIRSDHDIRNAFDAITYTKGGALLAMFERYLGAEAFRNGLRLYLARHRFGTGTSADLLAALEESAGKAVAGPFSSFLDQPGAPSVSVELRCSEGSPPTVRLAQRRYVPLGSSLDPAGALWKVPVCLRHGIGKARGEQCTLLETPEAELALDSAECPHWLYPNAHAAGYYRWALGDAELAALLDAGSEVLETTERISLLANTEAAARTGQRTFEQLMRVTRASAQGRERELVQSALGVLVRVRDALLDEAQLPAYRGLVRELVASRQKQLGLFPVPRESGDAKLLRPVLVTALAFEARDAALRQDLERLGRAQLGLAEDKRSARLSSELYEAALSVAVQEGGAPVIERAVGAISRSNDGIERGRLLSALGNNQRPELTPAVLELALSDPLRTNERLVPLVGQLRQRETREAAYTWVEEHFDALVGRLGADLGAQLTQVAGAFCSAPDAERARKFLEPRVDALTGGPRLLRLNLETTALCAAFAAAHRDPAKKYFATATGS